MRAFARQMTERMKAVAAAGAVAAFWLAVWVLVAGLVAQPLILPGPGAVVVALLRLVCDAGTCEHRGGLFDGAAGRVFLAGRGFDANG